jgi:hypothetical protein
MIKQLELYLTKVQKVLKNRKIVREILEEFFNHGIGYLAGLLAYNYLSRYIEVKGIKNLWGFAKNKNKILVSKDTFESIEFIISAVVGFIIFKIVTHYSQKIWTKYEQSQTNLNVKETE